MNLALSARIQGRADARRRTARAFVHLITLSILSLPLHLLLEPHGHGWEVPGVSTPAEHHEEHHSDPGEESSGHAPHWAADHVLDAVVFRPECPADDVLALDSLDVPPLLPSVPPAGPRERIKASAPSPPHILRSSPTRAPPSSL